MYFWKNILNMKKLYYSLILLLSVFCFGQNPADRDFTFNNFVQPQNQFFIDTEATKTIVLDDGKLLVLIGNTRLVKLDNNLLDNSFQLQVMTAPSGFTAPIIDDFIMLADGKIMISGAFDSYAGQTRRDVARLNSDGSLDTTFAYSGNMTRISQIIAQADGSFYFMGDKIVRVSTTGIADPTFVQVPVISFGRIALQQGGKLIVTHSVAGNYNNGIHKISRLNLDGTIDLTFTSATFSIGLNGSPDLREIVLQQDGKILVGGKFSSCNGIMMSGIARLTENGVLDTSFATGNGFLSTYPDTVYRINEIVEQADHKLLIGGIFATYNDVARKNILRLNIDGSLDESFNDPNSFINHGEITSIALSADSNIFLSGTYDAGHNYDSYMVKLLPNGTKNTSYSNISKGFFSPQVEKVIETVDGKLLVAGEFHTYNDQFCYNFTRLNADGSRDLAFNNGGLSGFEGPEHAYPAAIGERADGKIFVAGTFSTYSGSAAKSVILLNPDGSRDMTFNAGNGVDHNVAFPGIIRDILATPENGVLVGGNFSKVGQFTDASGLANYTASGSVDIYPKTIVGNNIFKLTYQADGKLLVAAGNKSLLRFNSGLTTVDDTFLLPPAVKNGNATSVEVQQDGKIMILGAFTVSGVSRELVRVNENGSLDTSFNFSLDNSQLFVKSFRLLPDGKIMVQTSVNDYSLNYTIRRLNSNGTPDPTFDIQSEFGGRTDFLPLSSGKLILYGLGFRTYQGQAALGVVQLMGEDYNFIQGQNRFDLNQDGCDATDPLFSNLKYNITGTTGNFDFIANASGNYYLGMTAGDYTITPTFENPAFFTATPSTIAVSFPSAQSPLTQQFCITANGVHPDLETIIIPVTHARPGFEAIYKVVYRNKGNQIQSGTLNLQFDDAVLVLVSASPAANTTAVNNQNWTFSALQPYETRSILMKFILNSPTENPAVNAGSILPFTAVINSDMTDESPLDNSFQFNQTVVNSFDPNDKTCLQGSTISVSQVGDYVHYLIRFENNGTAPAQTVRVTDAIDVSKYEISSLTPIAGSHLFTTRIADDNLVEFLFENINLPFSDATNDGFLAFKIKTKSSLIVGDSFSNSASIYFDYNAPIITNIATTVIQTLGTSAFASQAISIYPNPARDVLHISNPGNLNFSTVQIYNLVGQLLSTNVITAGDNSINISKLPAGNYIVVFATDAGKSSLKFIKK